MLSFRWLLLSCWAVLLAAVAEALHSPSFEDSPAAQPADVAFRKLVPQDLPRGARRGQQHRPGSEHEQSHVSASVAKVLSESFEIPAAERRWRMPEKNVLPLETTAASAAVAVETTAEEAKAPGQRSRTAASAASSWREAAVELAIDARDILLGLPVFEGFPAASQLSSAMTLVRHKKAEALIQSDDFELAGSSRGSNNASGAMQLMFNKTSCVTEHVVNEIGCVAECQCRWFMQCYPYNIQVKQVAEETAYSVNVGVCELAIFTMFVVSTLMFVCWVATFLCLFRKLRDETSRS